MTPDEAKSDLWPCPECAGSIVEKAAGRLDYWLTCNRCGWKQQQPRDSNPIQRRLAYYDDRFRVTRRSYDA